PIRRVQHSLRQAHLEYRTCGSGQKSVPELQSGPSSRTLPVSTNTSRRDQAGTGGHRIQTQVQHAVSHSTLRRLAQGRKPKVASPHFSGTADELTALVCSYCKAGVSAYGIESLVCESAKSWTLPQLRQTNASRWRRPSPSSAQFPKRRCAVPLDPPVRKGMSPMSAMDVWHPGQFMARLL